MNILKSIKNFFRICKLNFQFPIDSLAIHIDSLGYKSTVLIKGYVLYKNYDGIKVVNMKNWKIVVYNKKNLVK